MYYKLINMKKIILIFLSALITSTTIVSGQTNKSRQFSISKYEKELGILLNQHRQKINDSLKGTVIEPLSLFGKSIYLSDSLLMLKRSPILDSACLYHNLYLMNLSKSDEPLKRFTIMHEEKEVYKHLRYTGKNKILTNAEDRVALYDKEKIFRSTGEIISMFNGMYFFFRNERCTEEILAKETFQGWLGSPGHRSVIELRGTILQPFSHFGVSVQQNGTWICSIIIVECTNAK